MMGRGRGAWVLAGEIGLWTHRKLAYRYAELSDGGQQIPPVPRLGELQIRLPQAGNVRFASDRDTARSRRSLPHRPDEVPSREVGQAHVGHEHAIVGTFELADGLCVAPRGIDLEPLASQLAPQRASHGGVVLDDEDAVLSGIEQG